MPITISLVEDHAGMRESLAALLNGAPGLCCVGMYASGSEAVRQIPLVPPDVVLVDINLPGMSGIECVARIKGRLPELRVLMLTMHEESDLIFDSLRAGASGYLLKNTPSAELLQAIKEVHAGGAPMTLPVARKIVKRFQQSRDPQSGRELLTKPEQEVLELLGQGCPDREVAQRLNMTLGTVRTHLQLICKKLSAQSGAQAVVKFLGFNLQPSVGCRRAGIE